MGRWFGRWGVNYLYGTFLVLRGLQAMEMSYLETPVQQAAEWIRMMQNPMADGVRRAGHMTIRTSAGLGRRRLRRRRGLCLGLLAANDTRSDSVAKGIRWLIERQHKMGPGMS